MPMMRFFALAVAGILLAGCATTPRPTQPQPQAVLAKLQAMGVAGATYDKIAAHRILTFTDLYGLVQKKVPSAVILTYVKSTHAPYTLSNGQLNALNDAGANADLLNYLGKSVGFFEATESDQTGQVGKWRNDPYFVDPYYMGEAPFDGMWPGEWYSPDWVDSAF